MNSWPPPPATGPVDMEPPRTISVSQVNAYLGCPLKYRFQYVERIPWPCVPSTLVFGTAMHAAVAEFHEARLEGRTATLEELHEMWIALDEVQVSRRHAAREQRRRDSAGAGAELDDARRHADVPRHQPGQRLAARRERTDRERIANPPLQEVAEIIVRRVRMLKFVV